VTSTYLLIAILMADLAGWINIPIPNVFGV
jgi:hypothetical protein